MNTQPNKTLAARKVQRKFLEIQEKMLAREAQYLSFGYDIEKERNWILEVSEPIRGKILEAGTGKGYFSLALAKKKHTFTSFDISKESQEIAKLHLRHYGLNRLARFVMENGESLSFKDQSFDAVFSVNTLHHLENPVMVMNELTRVLSVGGKLVLCDFNDQGFDMMRKIHAMEGGVHDSGKFRLYQAALYLKARRFKTHKEESAFQEILIAVKQP